MHKDNAGIFRNSVLEVHLSVLCGHVCGTGAEGRGQLRVSSPYHVGPGNGPQVIRYSDKNL